MPVFARRYEYHCTLCGSNWFTHLPPKYCPDCEHGPIVPTGRYFQPVTRSDNVDDLCELVKCRPSRKHLQE